MSLRRMRLLPAYCGSWRSAEPHKRFAVCSYCRKKQVLHGGTLHCHQCGHVEPNPLTILVEARHYTDGMTVKRMIRSPDASKESKGPWSGKPRSGQQMALCPNCGASVRRDRISKHKRKCKASRQLRRGKERA